MPNLASQLNDISIIRSVLLQQLGSSISNDIKKAYLDILDDLRSKILRHDALDAVRSKAIIKEIKSIVFPTLPIYDQLQELAIDERDWLIASSNAVAGAEIFRAIPPESVIVAIGKAPAIEGALLKQWVSGLNDKLKFDFERSINMSMLQGESTNEATKRLSSVMGVSMNQAETLARTAIADVSNRVRETVYEDNSDVIKGREFCATLDGRVSEGCLVRDGATYDLNGKPINDIAKRNDYQKCPRHMRCRSFYSVVLKSWDEIDPSLGWKTEIPQTTRASLDGQVSSDINFTEWVKGKDKAFINKLLGEKRAELYLSGKITLNDLVTKGGIVRNLKQLREISNKK